MEWNAKTIIINEGKRKTEIRETAIYRKGKRLNRENKRINDELREMEWGGEIR